MLSTVLSWPHNNRIYYSKSKDINFEEDSFTGMIPLLDSISDIDLEPS